MIVFVARFVKLLVTILFHYAAGYSGLKSGHSVLKITNVSDRPWHDARDIILFLPTPCALASISSFYMAHVRDKPQGFTSDPVHIGYFLMAFDVVYQVQYNAYTRNEQGLRNMQESLKEKA
ncbi:hypothetical protein HGM15179_007884 [Zosterops borbonicus]|uniref:Uncharacterized protein n=1 Tax=Zosterops borbonicus TaxID=364589 RepID=A0A8K1GJW8_9PASS|nr:hypothetical protein HGM15179_007884 [Zosterops borbonicus]